MTDTQTWTITNRLHRLPTMAAAAAVEPERNNTDDTATTTRTPGPRLPPGVADILDAMTEGREIPHLLGRLTRTAQTIADQLDDRDQLNRQRTWAALCSWLTANAHHWQHQPDTLAQLDHDTADIERQLADRIHTRTGRCAYCTTTLRPHTIGPLVVALCPTCDRVAHMRLTVSPDKADRWQHDKAINRARELLDLEPAPQPADEIAAALGVSPHTIRSWASRGLLAQAGRDGRRKLYRLADAQTCANRHAE